MPGAFGRVNFNLGPASFTVNGALTLVNSAGNIFADGIGALTSPFDTYQGEITSAETGLGPGTGIAIAGTLLLARVSTGIRAASAASRAAYSVAYEVRLAANPYPGVSRGTHFREANNALLKAMESDSEFSKMMQQAGVNVNRTAMGLAPRTFACGLDLASRRGTGFDAACSTLATHGRQRALGYTSSWGGRGGYFIWGKE